MFRVQVTVQDSGFPPNLKLFLQLRQCLLRQLETSIMAGQRDA